MEGRREARQRRVGDGVTPVDDPLLHRRLETREPCRDLRHFAGVRASERQPTIAESPLSTSNGGVVSVDVTLAPGTYQIFCRNNGHDQLGMKIPLTVTP